MTVTVTDTILTDDAGRNFDLASVCERADGSFVVVMKHPTLGDLPFQVTQTGAPATWVAINEWKADHPENFEAAETEEAAEAYEDRAAPVATEDVDGEGEPLFDELRTTKLRRLEQRFERARREAVIDSSLGLRADADPDSIQSIIGMTMLAADGRTVRFCDADNLMHDLALTNLKILRREVLANAQNLREQKWSLRDAIEAAGTVEEVRAVKLAFSNLAFSAEE